MTEITLNKKNYQFHDGGSIKTVHDLFNTVLKDSRFADHAVTALTIDNMSFDPYNTPINLLELEQLSSIDIELKSALEIAQMSLSDLPSHIDEVIAQVNQLVLALQKNNIDLVNEQFAATIEVIDLFTQLTAKVIKTLRKNYLFSEKLDMNIRRTEIHLLSVLKSVLPAKEKNDLVMMSDLLEYELVDNLNQWKHDIVPQMKTAFSL